jgi:hypothetical protein
MNPRVRDLYKRFLLVGKDYPQGLSFVRIKAKAAFVGNRDISDPTEIKKCIAKGRYWVRELQAISKLHKYRNMNKRYNVDTYSVDL